MQYTIYIPYTIQLWGDSGGTQGAEGAGSTWILSGGTGRPREPEGSQEAEGAGSSRRPGLGYFISYLLCAFLSSQSGETGSGVWLTRLLKKPKKQKKHNIKNILRILTEILDFLKNLLILIDFYWNPLDFIWNPWIWCVVWLLCGVVWLLCGVWCGVVKGVWPGSPNQ